MIKADKPNSNRKAFRLRQPLAICMNTSVNERVNEPTNDRLCKQWKQEKSESIKEANDEKEKIKSKSK